MGTRQSRMTVGERWKAIINRKPVDRVPFFVMGINIFCCKNVGYTVEDTYNNVQRAFDAQVKSAEQYGYYPFTYPGTCAAFWTWGFGGEIKWPKSEYEMAPSSVRYPVQSEEDVKSLKIPSVREGFTALQWNMDFCKLQEAFPGMPIVPALPAPITLAGSLVGAETLCKWMMKKPELVHQLARTAANHLEEVAEYWANTFDRDRIVFYLYAPNESNQLISPKQFEKFAFPYQKEVHEKVLATGIRHIYVHICGDQNLNLPYWEQIPMGDPGILSFGHEVDLERAAECFPNDIITGNIHSPTLQIGTGEEVYELCRGCIEKGKKAKGGFMLASGCCVPPATPSYNYYIMQKALNDFGWYD